MKKGWVFNSILFIAAILLSLCIGEWMCRFFRLKEIVSPPVYTPGYLVADAQNGYDLARSFPSGLLRFADSDEKIWTNELSCFDRPYEGEKDYIVLAGDSFAWGYVSFDEKFGTLLGGILSRRVIQCGVPGYGTKQELIKVQRTISEIKNPPSLIILCYFSENDFTDDCRFPARTVFDGQLFDINVMSDNGIVMYDNAPAVLEQKAATIRRFGMIYTPHGFFSREKALLRHESQLYHAVGGLFSRLFPRYKSEKIENTNDRRFYCSERRAKYPWVQKAYEEHLQNLKGFQVLADRYGARLLVVLIPSKYMIYPALTKGTSNSCLKESIAQLKAFMGSQGIAYLDLKEKMIGYVDAPLKRTLNSKKDLYWKYDWHFSPRGNRLVAACIAEEILKKRFLAGANQAQERIKAIFDGFKK